MKVLIKGVHLRVWQRLRAYLEDHLVQPLVHFHDDEATELEIHLVDANGEKGGTDKECRVTLRMPGAKTIHVVEATDDIYKSVSLARDRLERLMKRALAKMRQPAAHRVSNPAGRLAPRRAFSDPEWANDHELPAG
jgi:ribosomal subunit interface protein